MQHASNFQQYTSFPVRVNITINCTVTKDYSVIECIMSVTVLINWFMNINEWNKQVNQTIILISRIPLLLRVSYTRVHTCYIILIKLARNCIRRTRWWRCSCLLSTDINISDFAVYIHSGRDIKLSVPDTPQQRYKLYEAGRMPDSVHDPLDLPWRKRSTRVGTIAQLHV